MSGRRYQIIELTERVNTDLLLDPDNWEDGARILQLPNGNRVFKVRDGVYCIASTGEFLYREW